MSPRLLQEEFGLSGKSVLQQKGRKAQSFTLTCLAKLVDMATAERARAHDVRLYFRRQVKACDSSFGEFVIASVEGVFASVLERFLSTITTVNEVENGQKKVGNMKRDFFPKQTGDK